MCRVRIITSARIGTAMIRPASPNSLPMRSTPAMVTTGGMFTLRSITTGSTKFGSTRWTPTPSAVTASAFPNHHAHALDQQLDAALEIGNGGTAQEPEQLGQDAGEDPRRAVRGGRGDPPKHRDASEDGVEVGVEIREVAGKVGEQVAHLLHHRR